MPNTDVYQNFSKFVISIANTVKSSEIAIAQLFRFRLEMYHSTINERQQIRSVFIQFCTIVNLRHLGSVGTQPKIDLHYSRKIA